MKALLAVTLLALAAGSHARDLQEVKRDVIVVAKGHYYAPNFYAAFKKAGLKRWTALVNRAGLKPYFSNPRLKITAWPPQDYAFNEILKDINCTFTELLKNKHLVKQLVLYHTTPGMRVFTKDWPAWPKAKYIPSGLVPLGQRGKWLKIEMDDQPSLDPDNDWFTFDIDGSDDDAELEEPISKFANLLIGNRKNRRFPGGVMSVIDDVMTWKGLKAEWKRSLRA